MTENRDPGVEIDRILRFARLAERLKAELRHAWLSTGRRESVADHSWQLALLALITYRHLEHSVDLDRVLRMIVVHDLAEAEVGDLPSFETGPGRDGKPEREQEAIARMRDMLDSATGAEIFDLFHEYHQQATYEAKLVKALDNLEVQMQHNLADLSTWEPIEYELVYTKMDPYCAHDRCLLALCDAVKRSAEEKLKAAGVDVEGVKQGAAARLAHPAPGSDECSDA